MRGLSQISGVDGSLSGLHENSQYAAGDYRKILQAIAITQSMSRKANCWDNAPMESFSAS